MLYLIIKTKVCHLSLHLLAKLLFGSKIKTQKFTKFARKDTIFLHSKTKFTNVAKHILEKGRHFINRML